MAWVTWRQHRTQLLVAGALLLAVAVTALATSLPVRDAYNRQALASCLPPSARSGCELIVAHFRSQFRALVQGGRYLFLLPALALLAGAPLLARELEQGTFRLAWTQGVSRRRWLLAKTLLLGAGVAAAAAALAVITAWWRGPFDRVDGRMQPASFDIEGVVVPAYALFALAAGILAGLVVRRTLPAISIAAALFVATRLGVEKLLRPYYLEPRHRAVPGAAPVARLRDWVTSDTLVDGAGRAITTAREDLAVVHAQQAGLDVQQYLASLGWRRLITYQPADRFWTFQAIEAGIFVLLAAAAVAAAILLLRRRPA